ncbi:MAG: tetratricopeptide repeat protein [Polyangiaceae bacterium]|nr:tetratricopeptide repeat protein [Polyangiaceae bacterium]
MLVVAALAVLCSLVAPARAAPRDDREAQALAVAAEARARADPKTAIATLKEAWDELPHSEAIVLALAGAYLADQNPTWAVRVLSEHLDYHEDACNPRFLLAWIHIRSGMPELAHELLDGGGCDEPPEIRARGKLVRAYLAHLEAHDEAAREHLRKARRSRRIFAEDRAYLAELTRELDPPRASPVATGRTELGLGWTSNGLAGSPVDAGAANTVGSPLTLAGANLRVLARGPLVARPVLEGQLRIQELWAREAQKLSFGTGSARAGLLLGQGSPEVLLALSTEATLLAGNDQYEPGPLWFTEAQRGEIELGLGDAFAIFAGGGRRRFREIGRTRTEGELSLGWGTVGPLGIRAIGGSSIRVHDARNDAYDLAGASLVVQLWLPLRAGFEANVTAGANADLYHQSREYFGGAGGSNRRDLQLRFGAGAWSPRRHPVRVGLTLERTSRSSSAEVYDYVDWRGLLRLEWRFDSDTLGRRTIEGRRRARFDYGTFASGGKDDLGEVRELMRQDEAAQSGASCLR